MQITPTFSTNLPGRQPGDNSRSVSIMNRTTLNVRRTRKSLRRRHRAIAALAAQGFIKVIITTNFDRLVETALRDEGIEPTILSSLDQVQGALPLIHTQCCVFKVHGDYLDSRIRNTPAELKKYPPEFVQLLDRIFDEFGLIRMWLVRKVGQGVAHGDLSCAITPVHDILGGTGQAWR